MQMLPKTFLALLLAHLLSDFPLQTEWIASKKGGRLAPTLVHGVIHFLTAWTCLKFFTANLSLTFWHWAAVLVYVVTHLAIDSLKYWLVGQRKISANAISFLFDQLVHVATAGILAMILTSSSYTDLFSLISISEVHRGKLLVGAIVYVGVIFGGGYGIRYCTRGLASGILTEPSGQLRNAGLYIGWIERFLVITAIAIQSPALVGLILTVKSIARFPELKEARFAEYFLIGTLLSVALALTGGLILAFVLYGTISLK